VKFKNLVKISLLVIALNFQACSYVNTDKIGRVLSTDYYELDTTPKDSTLYQCEENKEFYLRDIPGVEENIDKWLILKNMEYRLNYIDDVTYQNDMLTLKFSNSEANVKTLIEQDNNDLVFTNCNPVRSK
jgi:hypothetical protein